MLARVQSYLLQGIDAHPCEVEIDHNAEAQTGDGMPRATVVGLPDASVKESIERVRSAMFNSGFMFPTGRTLINLAPADVRKEGPVYDLPIAVGLLIAQGVVGRKSKATAHSTQRHSTHSNSNAAANGVTVEVRVGKPGVKAAAAANSVESMFADAVDSPSSVSSASPASSPSPSHSDDDGLDVRHYLFAGELALDGRLRPVRGVLALAALAAAKGYKGVIVPAENAAEASVVPGVESIGVRTLAEVVGLLSGLVEPRPHPPLDIEHALTTASALVDFSDVRGQEAVKRAIVIACGGLHNVIMLGPAGTGKTMMARALPGVLPPLTPQEAIEITRIYSAAGQLQPGQGLITVRPVRTPHHTASGAAIVGGGIVPKPGEISLSHRGVLFMDELPEFPRDVLETLRQPLEDHVVTIARSHSAVRFPANFMLVAAMNPTPKGDIPTDQVGKRAMDRYLSKLSGPLIDRIDIHVEAPAVPWKQLSESPRGTTSAQMREQVLKARQIQNKRQGATTPNSRLSGRQLDTLAPLNDEARTMLGQAMTELGLSARAYDKVRRVSRTIADIEGAESINATHVGEAIQYRLLDRKA